jgi:hypothetical protein
MILVIVVITVMYTIMIIHVSVAELFFEIQNKHCYQLGNGTSHAHQPRSLIKGHLQVPGVNHVTVDNLGQIITAINVVFTFLKDFF